MDATPTPFADKVRRLCDLHGQRGLASLLGCSQATVSGWCRGAVPSATLFVQLKHVEGSDVQDSDLDLDLIEKEK